MFALQVIYVYVMLCYVMQNAKGSYYFFLFVLKTFKYFTKKTQIKKMFS